MSLTCHLCGAALDQSNGYIPVIGEVQDAKLARWIDSAGRHMAAMHPHVMTQVVEASALIGYLILAANFRTDEPAIEERTRHALEHTVKTVDRLEGELKPDPERILRTF